MVAIGIAIVVHEHARLAARVRAGGIRVGVIASSARAKPIPLLLRVGAD